MLTSTLTGGIESDFREMTARFTVGDQEIVVNVGSPIEDVQILEPIDETSWPRPDLPPEASSYELTREMDRTLGLHTTDNQWENWGGRGEKWFQGAGDQWYFILPGGEVFRWDGGNQARGRKLLTLDSTYHSDLNRLVTAYDPHDKHSSSYDVNRVGANLAHNLGLHASDSD